MNASVLAVSLRNKRPAILLVAIGLFFGSADVKGQTKEAPSDQSSNPKSDTPQSAPSSQRSGVEILTDTQGVDFGPYMRTALATIKKNWLPLIPEEARPPANVQGETLIRFTITPDGKIGAMHLDQSSQHDNIDRAAWGAIAGVGQFPPLPTEFKGPKLELRIDFLTNLPLPLRVTPLDHITGGASMPR